MRWGFRHFLSVALAAAIVLASGATGYAAYVPHDGHAGLAHILGGKVGHHHHHEDDHRHHDAAGATSTAVLLCDVHASCDVEPGDAASHCHVSSLSSPGVAPGDCGLIFAALLGDKPIAFAAFPLHQGRSDPLLRPPTALL